MIEIILAIMCLGFMAAAIVFAWNDIKDYNNIEDYNDE